MVVKENLGLIGCSRCKKNIEKYIYNIYIWNHWQHLWNHNESASQDTASAILNTSV